MGDFRELHKRLAAMSQDKPMTSEDIREVFAPVPEQVTKPSLWARFCSLFISKG